MPGKKKRGKKSGKKKGKSGSSSGKRSGALVSASDGFLHPPPLPPREKLIKLLTSHKVDEKELHGFTVSTRALEQLTPQEIRDLHMVFEAFDIHGKGYIGPIEVRRALKALGFKISKDQVKHAVKEASTKGISALNFNEFLDIIIARQSDSRDIYDEILQGFKMFDYDKVGKISFENLKEASREAGVTFSKQELFEMMEEADQNGDGFVDKEEFIKIMLETNLF